MRTKAPFIKLGSILFLSLNAFTVQAFEIEHGTHVHGQATMNIAVEAKEVLIELDSPMFNIVGFEHEATTEQGKQLLREAQSDLKKANQLFSFNSEAHCRYTKSRVAITAEKEKHELDKHEHEHDKHEHEHDKHEHEHDKHEHKHDEHENHESYAEEETVHQSVEAVYTFKCGHPERLNHIQFKLFERFPNLDLLDVNLISEKGALKKELTKENTEIQF